MKKILSLVLIAATISLFFAFAGAENTITIGDVSFAELLDENSDPTGLASVTVSFSANPAPEQVTVMLSSEEITSSTANPETKIIHLDQIDSPVDNTFTFIVSESRIAEVTGLEDIEGCTLYIKIGGTDISTPSGKEVIFSVKPVVLTLGDLDNDGYVTVRDNMLLSRQAASWSGYNYPLGSADLDNDGYVTVKDDAILARHLAGWTGYETFPYIVEDE